MCVCAFCFGLIDSLLVLSLVKAIQNNLYINNTYTLKIDIVLYTKITIRLYKRNKDNDTAATLQLNMYTTKDPNRDEKHSHKHKKKHTHSHYYIKPNTNNIIYTQASYERSENKRKVCKGETLLSRSAKIRPLCSLLFLQIVAHLFILQLLVAIDDRLAELDHVGSSLVPVCAHLARLYAPDYPNRLVLNSASNMSNDSVLTNPECDRNASTMPATKTAQFSEPLSFGTLMNLFTSGWASMM